MMTAIQALELAIKYEEKGNMKMVEFYFRHALIKEDLELASKSVGNILASYEAVQSAIRSVTGSIHR